MIAILREDARDTPVHGEYEVVVLGGGPAGIAAAAAAARTGRSTVLLERYGFLGCAETVAGLIASFQSELTDDPSGIGAERFLSSVSAQAEREYLASARYRYLLAFSGSEFAGFIAIRDGSHLFHLFVGRAHQRQGLGGPSRPCASAHPSVSDALARARR